MKHVVLSSSSSSVNLLSALRNLEGILINYHYFST